MKVRGSLHRRILLTAFLGLTVVIISTAYVLFATLRLQETVNAQFATERELQNLQEEVVAIRAPLLNYLSSRSSRALADLLIEEQVLRGLLPASLPIRDDFASLARREIYALLESYLDLTQEAIQLKRARAIDDYTRLYEEMAALNEYIVERIDRLSLSGLRAELSRFEEIIEVSRELLFWNMMVIILAFLGSTLWISLSVGRITDPMSRLTQMAGELAAGNFEIDDLRVETVREMGTVIEAFNTMKHDIRKYIGEISRRREIEQGYMEERLRNLRMEHLLRRMELYTMQAQMNPHFLFNTLNTGVQIAITENAERTADFMEHLAEFFRNNMRERNLFVPLRREVESLDNYLYILRIRFARSIQFDIDVPESLLDTCTVPALILQPLVENSVIHAFRGIDHQGAISITAVRLGSVLVLTVCDNGVGIDDTTIARLLDQHDAAGEHDSKVMGLTNVIHRLHFFYPDQEDVISIGSLEGGGTEIAIRIDTEVEPCIPS